MKCYISQIGAKMMAVYVSTYELAMRQNFGWRSSKMYENLDTNSSITPVDVEKETFTAKFYLRRILSIYVCRF